MDRWKILRSADWAIILTIIRVHLIPRTPDIAQDCRLDRFEVRYRCRRRVTFRNVADSSVQRRTSRSTFPTFLSVDFQIFPKSFSIRSLSRELETIRLDYKFSFSVLSGFIIIIITNSSLIEMIFQFCHSRPVISKEIPNLLFRVFRSRILLWDVNWKNLREESSQGNESKFFLPRLARCDKNGKRWTRRKGRLIYHDPAS